MLNDFEEHKKEDELLIAKINDKINFSKTKNKIAVTDFLDEYQQNIAEKQLKSNKIESYKLYGGYDDSIRKIVFIFSEKLKFLKENYENYGEFIKVIRIILPNDLKGKYSHRDYLGAVIKIGIERRKIRRYIV